MALLCIFNVKNKQKIQFPHIQRVWNTYPFVPDYSALIQSQIWGTKDFHLYSPCPQMASTAMTLLPREYNPRKHRMEPIQADAGTEHGVQEGMTSAPR